MYTEDHYNKFWENIINQLPRGGSYRFDQRAEAYGKIMDLIPEGSTVFDYACGLAMASIKLSKDKKCKVAGCDFSSVAINYAKKESGGDFRATDKVFGGPYDFVILSHYLEHIDNPAEFLNELFKFTNNIIISLPNNFRHIGEHELMQWSNWTEFNELFKDFTFKRVDQGYTTKTHHAWHHPIFLFTEEKNMHQNYIEEKPVKKPAKKKRKVNAKKKKITTVNVEKTENIE